MNKLQLREAKREAIRLLKSKGIDTDKLLVNIAKKKAKDRAIRVALMVDHNRHNSLRNKLGKCIINTSGPSAARVALGKKSRHMA